MFKKLGTLVLTTLFLALGLASANFLNWNFVGDENFQNQVNQMKITVSDSNTPYIAYSDQSCNGRLTVKKFENNTRTGVGNSCITQGLTQHLYTTIKPGTEEIFVSYFDFNNPNRFGIKKFNGTTRENLSLSGLQANSYYLKSLIFDDNGNLFVAQNRGNEITVNQFNGTERVQVGNTLYGSTAKINFNDKNDPYIFYKNSSGKGSVKRLINGTRTNIGDESMTPETIDTSRLDDIDIEFYGSKIFVSFVNDSNIKLSVASYNQAAANPSRQFVGDQYLGESQYSAAGRMAITENGLVNIIFRNLNGEDSSIYSLSGGNRVETKHLSNAGGELFAKGENLYLLYINGTFSTDPYYISVMSTSTSGLVMALPDLTIEDMELAYGYGSSYGYGYTTVVGTNSGELIGSVVLNESVLAFDVNISNIGDADSEPSFATCIEQISGFTTFAMDQTPILAPLDFANNMIRFSEDDARQITSTEGYKYLACEVDADQLINENDDTNNFFDFTFQVEGTICDIPENQIACALGSDDCPVECSFVDMRSIMSTTNSDIIIDDQLPIKLGEFNVKRSGTPMFVNNITVQQQGTLSGLYFNDVELYIDDEYVTNCYTDINGVCIFHINQARTGANERKYKIMGSFYQQAGTQTGKTIQMNIVDMSVEKLSTSEQVQAKYGMPTEHGNLTIIAPDTSCEDPLIQLFCALGDDECPAECTTIHYNKTEILYNNNVAAGTNEATLGEFLVSAHGAPSTMTSIRLYAGPFINYSDLTNIRLIDSNGNQISTTKNLNSSGEVNFNVSVDLNETIHIIGDISPSTPVNSIINFKILEGSNIKTSTSEVVDDNNLPITLQEYTIIDYTPAQLTVYEPTNNPKSQILIANSNENPIAEYKLTATDGAVNIEKLYFQNIASNFDYSRINTVKLYKDGVLINTSGINSDGRIIFLIDETISNGTSSDFTITADLNQIYSDSDTNKEIQLEITDILAEDNGTANLLEVANGDVQINDGDHYTTSELAAEDIQGELMYIRKTVPKISTLQLTTSNLFFGQQEVFRISITADTNEDISISALKFDINKLGLDAANPQLTINGTLQSILGSTVDLSNNQGFVYLHFNEVIIPAGSSKKISLYLDVSNLQSNAYLSTNIEKSDTMLAGEEAFLQLQYAIDNVYDIIWSDNSGVPNTLDSVSRFNSFLVPGLDTTTTTLLYNNKNLSISDIKLSTLTPIAGNEYKIIATVTNVGEVNTRPTSHNIQLPTDTKLLSTAGSCTQVKSIGPGGSCTYEFTVTTKLAGEKSSTVTVSLDDDVDPTDNTKTINYTVKKDFIIEKEIIPLEDIHTIKSDSLLK